MGISNQSNAASQSYANKDVINQLPLDKAFKNSFKDVRAGGKKKKSRNNKVSKKNKKVKKSMNNNKGKGNNSNNNNSNSNNNSNKNKKSKKQSKKRKNQKAGSVNFVLRVGEERIGGLARVDKFETQPVYKNGVPEVKQNDLGNRGSQGLCGGGKRKKKSGKKSNNNKSNNNKSNNYKSNNNVNKNKSNNNKSNNNVNKNKRKSKNKKKSRKMKGGNGENCFKMQQDALPSHYSDNMTTRKFDCNQPNWDPKCT